MTSPVAKHRLPGAPAKAWEVDVYVAGFTKDEVVAGLRAAADHLERERDDAPVIEAARTGPGGYRLAVEHRPSVEPLDYLEAWNAWWDVTYGVGRRPPVK